MSSINNPSRNDLIQLLGFGICIIVTGLLMAILFYKALSGLPLTFFPIEIIGSIIGIIFFSKGGGYIRWFFGKRVFTKEERQFSDLIAQKKNMPMVVGIGIIAVVIQIYGYLTSMHNIAAFNLDNLLGALFFPFLTIGMLCVGTKYISAWWNIRREL